LGYRRGWGYPSYGYWGGALATGLALGAATYPYYGYGYGGYPYDYGYYDDPYYGAAYGGDCYWVTRRVVGPYGGVVIRRVQVCGY
jgi:hypothetical protein